MCVNSPSRPQRLQALEDYGTQESSEQNNSELETKMEVARQSLRRAEVLCVCACVVESDFCFLNQSHISGVASVLHLLVE